MATLMLPPLTDEVLTEVGRNATVLGSLALELVAARRLLCPPDGPTLRDRLAELHDLLCSISARCDDEHVIWDDLQTAIGLAETLTDEAEAVTP